MKPTFCTTGERGSDEADDAAAGEQAAAAAAGDGDQLRGVPAAEPAGDDVTGLQDLQPERAVPGKERDREEVEAADEEGNKSTLPFTGTFSM